MNTRREIIRPLTKPTPTSLRICLPDSLRSSEPLARPWTTMALDCMPTFPPVPPIMGMNRAMAGLVTKPCSKFPRIKELPMPPTIPMRSHGRRALVWVQRVSSDSTSCDRPLAS